MRGSLTEISLVDFIRINCLDRRAHPMSASAILQEIHTIEGVAGSFVCDQAGRMLARSPVPLFDDTGKVLAMLPKGDPSPQELGPTVCEIERFSRLFIGRDQADDLADRLQSILSGS